METTHGQAQLTPLGITPSREVHWNHVEPRLYEATTRLGTGRVAAGGAMVVITSPYTGRSPKDKFVVRTPDVEAQVEWGSVNSPIEPAVFDSLFERVTEHLSANELWVEDLHAGK